MSYNSKELCDNAKELLKKELTHISYETWIKNMEIINITEDTITILVSSSFHKDLLENKYHDLIFNTFKYLTNKEYKLKIVCNDDINNEEISQDIEKPQNQQNFKGNSNSSLNPKYTFESFVIGNNNRFAHAASLAVAESPATSYNPLYIYGGVGLGKTHLMQAIGNKILETNPNAKILYITSEAFTNHMINALKDVKMEEFRNIYRNVDVLLIDDIQFIAEKERIQEEFFHTFNTLHENGKQVVISSDKPPKEIPKLEDRLKSRFEWGLLADISKPDYETRLAILRKKSEINHIVIDDDILANIAQRVDSNIRELEGIFNKLVAYSTLQNGPITMEMAEKAINDVAALNNNVISADYIQDVVSKYFNINKKDLKSTKRSNDIAYPRQIAMYLCRELANMSFPKIGEEFGKRDHTTVMHGYNKIEKEILDNTNTKLIVESVQKIILDKK